MCVVRVSSHTSTYNITITLAQQQSKLDASNLSIASFTWLRAFKDRTGLTYEHGTTTMITKLLATRCKSDIDYIRRDRHPPATYAKQVACQSWNRFMYDDM